MTYYILSDLHIFHPDCDLVRIWDLLQKIENENARIILVGDLVDAYIEDPIDIVTKGRDILLKIRDLTDDYVVGNHDNPILFSDKLKAYNDPFPVRSYPYKVKIVDGKKWYIEHGHLVGKWGLLFGLLDSVSGTAGFRLLVRATLKTEIASTIGRKQDPVEFRTAALTRFTRMNCDVGIFGHSHFPEIVRYERHTYINPGSGLLKLSYIKYSNGFFKIY